MVTQLVTGDVKGKTARRRPVAIHGPATRPGFRTQAKKQGERSLSHGNIVGEQFSHRQRLEPRTSDVLLLIETGELAAVATGQAQRAVGEDAFIVREVTQNLLDAPLACAVGDVAACIANARRVNPGIQILELSATTGEGMGAWLDWLLAEPSAAAAPVEAVAARIAALEAELAKLRALPA